MKDLPMFNKLFFVLYFALILCFTPLQAMADDNPSWEIIVKEYKIFDPMAYKDNYTRVIQAKRVFGTYEQRVAERAKLRKENLSSPEITKAQAAVDKENANYSKWREKTNYNYPESQYPGGKNTRKNLKNKLSEAQATQRWVVVNKIDSDSLIRETNNKEKKIEDARLAKIAADKVIEDERLAKIAAAKKIEDERLAKIAADKVIEDERLAKIAAAKKIEDERLAKIAAAKKIEEERLAKIAAAKKIEDARLAKIAADKVIEDARLAKIAAAKKIEDARLAKIAAVKKIEDARLAKIAAAKKIEDARLAKIAHAENVARAARIKEEIRKQQLEKKISSVLKIIAGINGPKDPNKITSITKDGQVRTLYCSSACTPGSVKLHEIITGIPMGVDVGTLTKRIEANAAQGKRQDNTNENNAKAAEDIASQGNVSIDTLFEQAEADIATHDTSFARAQSIPLGQRIRNREAHTEYVRSQSENEAYCLYEGC